MKRLFLTTAAATLCLSACGQSNSNNAAANGAANMQGTTGGMTGNMAGPAPAPGPMTGTTPGMTGDPAASGGQRAQLVGRWGRNGSCGETMEFRADGGISIPNTPMSPQVRWDVQGNQIVFSAPGEASQPIGSFTMGADGSTMVLTTAAGQSTTLTRCS